MATVRCRLILEVSISSAEIANGFHGNPNSSFPSRHSRTRLSFVIANCIEITERCFLLLVEMFGTVK